MKITLKQLSTLGACKEGKAWFKSQAERELRLLIKSAIDADHFDWANWLIVRLLGQDDKIRYAIFAAESVLPLFETVYPNNKLPREAIEATKRYLQTKSETNRLVAAKVAYAVAYVAANATYVAANAAASAADAVAYAASSAVEAADAAAFAAARAVRYATFAAEAAAKANCDLKAAIIEYGLRLVDAADQNGVPS